MKPRRPTPPKNAPAKKRAAPPRKPSPNAAADNLGAWQRQTWLEGFFATRHPERFPAAFRQRAPALLAVFLDAATAGGDHLPSDIDDKDATRGWRQAASGLSPADAARAAELCASLLRWAEDEGHMPQGRRRAQRLAGLCQTGISRTVRAGQA